MFRNFRLFLTGCSAITAVLTLGSCADDDDEKPIPAYVVSSKSSIVLEAGVDNILDIPVRVVSEDSTAIPGVRVFFSVTTGKAILSDSVAITDGDGIASIVAHLSKTAGGVTITAKVPGIKVPTATRKFYLQATVAKKIVIMSGDKQEALPKLKVKDEARFKVTDEFDNPVSNVTVSFASTSGDGTFARATGKTTQDGIVTNVFTAGTVDAVNLFTATAAPGISTVLTLYALQPVTLSKPTESERDVTLNWSENINPTFKSYIVYRTEDNSGNFVPLTEIVDSKVTIYKDTSPLTAKVYQYYVSVKSTTGVETKSSISLAQSGLYVDLTTIISPFDMKMNRDKSKIFIADRNQMKILILTTDNFRKADSVLLNVSPAAMTFSLDNTRLYVAIYNTSKYMVIDLPTRTILKTVDLTTTFSNKAVNDLFFTASNQLLVTSRGAFTVMIDEANNDAATKIASNTSATLTFIGQSDNSLYLSQSSTTPNEILKVKLDDPSMPLLIRSPNGKITGSAGSIVSPDGSSIYTLGGQIISTADLSNSNGRYSEGTSGVAVTSNGEYLYFPRGDVVNKVNTRTLRVEKTIPGVRLGSMLLSADERHAFLTYTTNFPRFQQRLYKLNIAP